jgi:hypothetical protein
LQIVNNLHSRSGLQSDPPKNIGGKRKAGREGGFSVIGRSMACNLEADVGAGRGQPPCGRLRNPNQLRRPPKR